MKNVLAVAAIDVSLTGCVEVSSSNEGLVASSGMVEECSRQIKVGRPDATISTRGVITAGPDNRVFVRMLSTVKAGAAGWKTAAVSRQSLSLRTDV